MNDNESEDTLNAADFDPRTTPLYKSSPERIGLAFGANEDMWQMKFDDLKDVTWYESDWYEKYPPISVVIEYVRIDVFYELHAKLELQTQIAADANAQLNEARRLLAESEFPEELFSTHDVYTGSGRSYDAVIDVLDTVVRMIRKRKDAAIAASKGG